jgi:hypothetical protein
MGIFGCYNFFFFHAPALRLVIVFVFIFLKKGSDFALLMPATNIDNFVSSLSVFKVTIKGL